MGYPRKRKPVTGSEIQALCDALAARAEAYPDDEESLLKLAAAARAIDRAARKMASQVRFDRLVEHRKRALGKL